MAQSESIDGQIRPLGHIHTVGRCLPMRDFDEFEVFSESISTGAAFPETGTAEKLNILIFENTFFGI